MAHSFPWMCELPTSQQRDFAAALAVALARRWEGTGEGRRLVLSNPEYVVRWYRRAARSGDNGLADAALVFWTWRNYAHSPDADALAFAFLACAARAYVDEDEEAHGILREAPYVEFGCFLRELLKPDDILIVPIGRKNQRPAAPLPTEAEDRARFVLDFIESLEDPPPGTGLARQPTAFLRGILLSPGFLTAPTGRFWALAAASARFPERIFSEPVSPFDNGHFLSPPHERRFGHLFGSMPEAAVVRFAGRMGREARTKLLLGYDEEKKRRFVYEVPVEDLVRSRAFKGILDRVTDSVRHALVSRLLGLSE